MNVPASVTDRVAAPLAAGFAGLAALRGGEGVHSRGLVAGGSLILGPRAGPVGAVLLDRPGRHRVLARLSWGVGPLGRLPDVPGLALRVLDADGRGGDQDLLVDGSLPAPHDRVLVLRRDLAGWYGSPLRLRLGRPDGPKAQVAVRLDGGGPGRLTLAGAAAAAAAGRLRGLLVVHDRGTLLASGWLRLDEVADPPNPEQPRFDPGVDAGGLVGAGFWHALRQRSYAASRRADPRTRAYSVGTSTQRTR